MRGDIEIHVKSSGWQAHRHQLDPAYNDVILHVFMWNDTGSASYSLDRRVIPALALDKILMSPVQPYSSSPGSNMPCTRSRDINSIATILDEAGEERFSLKAGYLKNAFTEADEGQVLYQGIMEALGYSRNKAACLELARRLPLLTLESIAREKRPAEECLAYLQAFLLGTAGLLPSQRPAHGKALNDRATKLEKLWAVSGKTRPIPYNAWNLFKVRPGNLPGRRLTAMSYLLLRYREEGLLTGIINLVKNTPPYRPIRLRDGLEVRAEDRPGCQESQLNIPLLGASRADDIIINVILPFIFVYGGTHTPELADKASGFYRSYPRLATNTIEKHMRAQLGLDSKAVNSARRQQGLLHIYKTMCIQARCHECRLS